MKKNSIFYLIFALFLLFFSSFHLFSENFYGKNLSNHIFNTLKKNNFDPEKQFFITTGKTENFPFNILCHVKEVSQQNKKEDTKKADINLKKNQNKNILSNIPSYERKHIANKKIIFAFKAEQFEKYEDFFIELAKSLKNIECEHEIDLVWTIGDEEKWDKNCYLKGIDSYISKINENKKLCAVTVRFLNEKRAKIIPGSGGDVSPSWLLKLTSDSFFSSGLSYNIKGGVISSLYRLNALIEDESTASFIKAKIPTIGIELCEYQDKTDDKKIFQKEIDALCRIASNFSPEKTENWERHTNQLSIGPKTFWLTERFTVITFIAIIFINLLLICEFSFVFRKNKKIFIKEFKSLWYFIPIGVLVTFICFMIGQLFSIFFLKQLNVNPFSAISIKLFVSFFIFSIISLTFIILKGNVSDKTYSFLQMLSALLNIFIFSSVDISLLYLFAIEYLIITICRSAKRLVSLEIAFLLMLVPFIPYGYQIILYAKTDAIVNFLSVRPRFNFLFATGFFPIILMWMRILAKINRKNKKVNSKKRWMAQNILAFFCVSTLFAIILIIFSFSVPERHKINEKSSINEQKQKIVQLNSIENENSEKEKLINLNYSDSSFFGEITRNIHLFFFKDCKHASISIEGNAKNPILYSEWDYETDSSMKKAYIKLPLNPPKNIFFNYITNNRADQKITVRCSFFDEENVIYEKDFFIPVNKK